MEEMTVDNDLSDSNIFHVQLPESGGSEGAFLPASTTTLVPIWYRPAKAGRHSIKFLFIYQAKVCYGYLAFARISDVTASIRICSDTFDSN